MYDPNIATLILFGSFVILILIRVPIAFTLVISAIFSAAYMHLPIAVLAQQMKTGIQSMSLLTIPLFILTGEIMSVGGISERMVVLANALVGRLRGGLALVDVISCMFFGGVTGSCVADVSAIGAIMIPMMKKKGYDDDYAVSITISGAVQGVLVPPSHNMILYSIAAGTIAGGASVGALFLAGIVPGVFLGISLMVLAYIIAVMRKYPKGNEPFSFKALWVALKGSILGLLTAIIIMAGILSGVFTAAESSAVAVVYAFIITFFVYREVKLSAMKLVLYKSTKTLAMVMTLIATASAFGYILATLNVPEKITTVLLSISHQKFLVLLMVNILLLILGCIMDMAPLILICTPILLPALAGYPGWAGFGVSPVHFGVILMLNLGIGLLTPPVGSALYVGCAIGEVSIAKMMKSMIPFYAVMIFVLMIITYFPEIAAVIPRFFGFKA
jgi:tripartite ATP-independent transporter DctM subunit